VDKREQILMRLVDIASAVPGINTAVRNQDELSERKRPAIAIFDADETADEASERQDHPGRAPNIVVMTPEVMILLGAAPTTVGSSLNSLRAKLVKAVLTDAQLTALVGTNGHVRYAGCSTHLGHGRSMEGFMGVHFAFAYVLRPEQL
jgi:hypothetical protein